MLINSDQSSSHPSHPNFYQNPPFNCNYNNQQAMPNPNYPQIIQPGLMHGQQNYIVLGQSQGYEQSPRGYILKWSCLSVLIQSIIYGFINLFFLVIFFKTAQIYLYPAIGLGTNIYQFFFSIAFLCGCKKKNITNTEIKIVKVFILYIPSIVYTGMIVYTLIKLFTYIADKNSGQVFLYVFIFIPLALILTIKIIIIWRIQARASRMRMYPPSL